MPLVNDNISVYQRGERYLIIFPQTPYWMVTRNGGYELVKSLCKCDSVDEVLKDMSQRCGFSITSEIVLTYLNNLEKMGVMKVKDFVNLTHQYDISLCDIALTNYCNLVCQCCYRECSHSGEVLSKDYLESFFFDLATLTKKDCVICFSGGEPLLVWELLIYSIELARNQGFENIYLETNATLVNADKARKLFDLGVKGATIILDGITEETHSITRPFESFMLIIQGMRILRDAGINVYVRMTAHTGNLHQIKAFLKFCESEGVYPSINPLAPLGRAQGMNYTPVLLNQILWETKEAVDLGLISPDKLGNSLNQIFRKSVKDLTCRTCCGTGRHEVFLDTHGNIYPCIDISYSSQFKIGSLKNNSLSWIWKNSEILKEIRSLHVDTFIKCKKCDLRYICAGHCRALTYKNTGRLDSPFIWCEDIHKSFIDMMWLVADEKENIKG